MSLRVLSDFHRLPQDVRKIIYKMIGRLELRMYAFAFMKAFDKTLYVRPDLRWELVEAIEFQSIPLIAWLKEEGVSWNVVAFNSAVATGNFNLVNWFIRYQCPVDTGRALCSSKTIEMFRFLSNKYYSTNREIEYEVIEHLFEEERFDWVLNYLRPSRGSFMNFIDRSFINYEELKLMTRQIYPTDRDANFFEGFLQFVEIYGVADYADRVFYEMLISYDSYEDVEPYLSKLNISCLNPENLHNFLRLGKFHTIRFIHQKFPKDFKIAWRKEYARYDDRELVEYMLDHEIPVNSDDTRFWKRLKTHFA